MLGQEDPTYCYLIQLPTKTFVVLYESEIKYWTQKHKNAIVNQLPFRPSWK